MLIAIDNPQQSVMHYMSDDTSAGAIAAEIKRIGLGAYAWREITPADYADIRATRPKPKPSTQIDTSGINTVTATALELILAKLEEMEADMTALDTKVEAVIDSVYTTDVEGS